MDGGELGDTILTAVGRIAHGRVPEEKDPRAVDRKLIRRYGIDASRPERARRKQAGLSNMQYIRHGKVFLLLATHGRHPFFEEEAGQIRDARRVSIKYAGYSLSFRNGRVCVRIEREEYKRLKARFLELACRRPAATLGTEFRRIRFVPYAPVRQQLLQIWRAVNRPRKAAGYTPVPVECVRWKRPIVKPFEGTEGHQDGIRLVLSPGAVRSVTGEFGGSGGA